MIESGHAANRLELRCVGREISAIINGVEVALAENTALLEGRVAIGIGVTADQPGTVEAWFDNLEVTTVDGPR